MYRVYTICSGEKTCMYVWVSVKVNCVSDFSGKVQICTG
jgi:hypothetical protein